MWPVVCLLVWPCEELLIYWGERPPRQERQLGQTPAAPLSARLTVMRDGGMGWRMDCYIPQNKTVWVFFLSFKMALRQKPGGLVNMSFSPTKKRPLEFQLEPPLLKRKSSSKLPLWVGPEVRVMGLKTESVVAPQPATGATYQPILMGRWLNNILQLGYLMLTNGWGISQGGRCWGWRRNVRDRQIDLMDHRGVEVTCWSYHFRHGQEVKT